MQKRNALIAGATGLVGKCLLQQLLADDQYDRIFMVSRKPSSVSNPKLIQQQIDFDSIEKMNPDFPIDDVFCALGTTIKAAGSQDAFYKVDYNYVVNLAAWGAANGVKRFLVVSAMGANAKSGIFYNRVKGEMELAVTKLNILHIRIFRPSLLMGKRKERRGGERLAQGFMLALGFLFAGPLLKYKGIEAHKVARAMVKAAREDRTGFRIYESEEMQWR